MKNGTPEVHDFRFTHSNGNEYAIGYDAEIDNLQLSKLDEGKWPIIENIQGVIERLDYEKTSASYRTLDESMSLFIDKVNKILPNTNETIPGNIKGSLLILLQMIQSLKFSGGVLSLG